jgi:hypothetical protein
MSSVVVISHVTSANVATSPSLWACERTITAPRPSTSPGCPTAVCTMPIDKPPNITRNSIASPGSAIVARSSCTGATTFAIGGVIAGAIAGAIADWLVQHSIA